jgi:hypothetical protein
MVVDREAMRAGWPMLYQHRRIRFLCEALPLLETWRTRMVVAHRELALVLVPRNLRLAVI